MSNKYLFLKSKSINSNFIVGYDGRIWEMPAQGGTAVADLQGHPLPNTQQIKHLRRPKVRIMDGRAHYKKYKLHQWHPLPLLFSSSGYPQIYDELYHTINTLYLYYSILQAAPDLRRALPHHQQRRPRQGNQSIRKYNFVHFFYPLVIPHNTLPQQIFAKLIFMYF